MPMRIDSNNTPAVSDGEVSPDQCTTPAPKPAESQSGNVVDGWKPAGGACTNAPSSQSRAPADLSCMIGDVGYYRARSDDFVQRHPGEKPPAYYLEYGEKYARLFTQSTAGKLSPEGKEWLEKTFEILQSRMEHLRETDPVAFEKLERDPEAFTRFAYGTHSDAYLDAGLRDLGIADIWHIGNTPEAEDLASRAGLSQAVITGGKVGLHKVAEVVAPGLASEDASVCGEVQP